MKTTEMRNMTSLQILGIFNVYQVHDSVFRLLFY